MICFMPDPTLWTHCIRHLELPVKAAIFNILKSPHSLTSPIPPPNDRSTGKSQSACSHQLTICIEHTKSLKFSFHAMLTSVPGPFWWNTSPCRQLTCKGTFPTHINTQQARHESIAQLVAPLVELRSVSKAT